MDRSWWGLDESRNCHVLENRLPFDDWTNQVVVERRETGRTSRTLSRSLATRRQCPESPVISQLSVDTGRPAPKTTLTTGILLLPSSKPPFAPASKRSAATLRCAHERFIGVHIHRTALSTCTSDGKRWVERVVGIVVTVFGEEQRDVGSPIANVSQSAAGKVSTRW